MGGWGDVLVLTDGRVCSSNERDSDNDDDKRRQRRQERVMEVPLEFTVILVQQFYISSPTTSHVILSSNHGSRSLAVPFGCCYCPT